MQPRHITSAVNILKSIHYINIATVCEDGSPWNTPVSASFDENLNFHWGSNPNSVHSQNIRRDSRAFVVVYDSTVPEGTGEGVYMIGKAEELENETELIKKYRFVPEKVWINDVVLDDKGAYLHDLRVELDLGQLKELLK